MRCVCGHPTETVVRGGRGAVYTYFRYILYTHRITLLIYDPSPHDLPDNDKPQCTQTSAPWPRSARRRVASEILTRDELYVPTTDESETAVVTTLRGRRPTRRPSYADCTGRSERARWAAPTCPVPTCRVPTCRVPTCCESSRPSLARAARRSRRDRSSCRAHSRPRERRPPDRRPPDRRPPGRRPPGRRPPGRRQPLTAPRAPA